MPPESNPTREAFPLIANASELYLKPSYVLEGRKKIFVFLKSDAIAHRA